MQAVQSTSQKIISHVIAYQICNNTRRILFFTQRCATTLHHRVRISEITSQRRTYIRQRIISTQWNLCRPDITSCQGSIVLTITDIKLTEEL